MPLRVTIDLIPHGDERFTETLTEVQITQIDQHDQDPGGERTYRYVAGPGGRMGYVRHHRRDGACELVRKVLEKLPVLDRIP